MVIRLHFVHCIASLLVIVCPATVAAASEQDISPPAFFERELKAGGFVWHPERSTSGPVEIIVSLSQQRAYVYRDGVLIGLSSVSTGTDIHPTPDGRFRILQKRKVHRSSKYDDAPMPYMMRLTWYGIALHGGHNPGYPASHGCIRLPHKFAESLFGIAPLQSTVIITHEAPIDPDEALQLARAHADPPDIVPSMPGGFP